MFFVARNSWYFHVFSIICVASHRNVDGKNLATPTSYTSEETANFLTKEIMQILDVYNGTPALDVNMKFAVLLGEFVIKQKVRFYESNRYEEQLYFGVLQKLNGFICKPLRADVGDLHQNILQNIFQRDILLVPPTLKTSHIDTHLEYKSLVPAYNNLVRYGLPNALLSDACLLDIVSLGGACERLRDDCLGVITTDSPTYGYRRMHQILLLYVFMHHQCSRKFGAPAVYELLANQKCTQVYREHNLIRALGLPERLRDLYTEQNVVCGLFGFAEFVNWPNLNLMHKWLMHPSNDTGNREHLQSLALVYYINALLLLA